jgi:hypothetical protein
MFMSIFECKFKLIIYSTDQNYKTTLFFIFLYDNKCLDQLQIGILIADEELYPAHAAKKFHRWFLVLGFLEN